MSVDILVVVVNIGEVCNQCVSTLSQSSMPPSHTLQWFRGRRLVGVSKHQWTQHSSM